MSGNNGYCPAGSYVFAKYKRNCIRGERDMGKKVVDIINYKIEKSLRSSGYTVKKDSKKNVTLLIKINQK